MKLTPLQLKLKTMEYSFRDREILDKSKQSPVNSKKSYKKRVRVYRKKTRRRSLRRSKIIL